MERHRQPDLHRYHHVDADPSAPDGSPARLRWEYLCLRLDAAELQRRANQASPDGQLSADDRDHRLGMVVAAMGVAANLRRALESERQG
jgi:hypothetical protein